MIRTLRIIEQGTAIVNDADGFQLSIAEATALSRLNQEIEQRYGTRWRVLEVDYQGGSPRRLRASCFVGAVSVGRKLIQIIPKMAMGEPPAELVYSEQAVANLVYMLGYTRKLSIREAGLAALPKSHGDLCEILIFLFADNLLRLVQNDTYKQYSSCEDVLPFLKGKLRFTEQIKQSLSCTPRFAVSYDEFGEDNPLNRVFLYVTSTLSAVTAREENSRLLRILGALFADVTLRQISTADVNAIHLNRLNRRFEPVLNLCKLFLEHQTVQSAHGGIKTYSFLFDMNKLFEEFIGEFIRRELRSEFTHVQLQRPGKDFVTKKSVDGVEHGSLFQMRPDIYLERPGAPPLIVDTKNKLLDPNDIKDGVLQQDLYQMYAYARKYGTPDVVLLYPRGPGQPKRDVCFEIESEPRTRVFVRTIDLCRDLRRYKAEFRAEIAGCLLC